MKCCSIIKPELTYVLLNMIFNVKKLNQNFPLKADSFRNGFSWIYVLLNMILNVKKLNQNFPLKADSFRNGFSWNCVV